MFGEDEAFWVTKSPGFVETLKKLFLFSTLATSAVLHGWYLRRPTEGVSSSGTSITDDCEPFAVWELKLGPLTEQPMLNK